MKRHDPIPKDFPVRPLRAGQKAKDKVTCGHCGLSWDDGKATSYTPAPGGRCPFEAFHVYEDEPPEITQQAARALLDACKLFMRAERDYETDGNGTMEMTFGEWCDHHHVGDKIAAAIARATRQTAAVANSLGGGKAGHSGNG